MTARIYSPTKNAMQSGRAGETGWVLEFERSRPNSVEPLMGWTSSSDMQNQVKLRFASKDEAIAYATRNRLAYTVQDAQDRHPKPASYADNFRFGRRENWTH